MCPLYTNSGKSQALSIEFNGCCEVSTLVVTMVKLKNKITATTKLYFGQKKRAVFLTKKSMEHNGHQLKRNRGLEGAIKL
jgi:hypothetical protein